MESSESQEVKYCVTAVIDLLGFSKHLEIGRNDLRTNIGREAVNRLQTLEKALQLMDAERVTCRKEYPKKFYRTRINDAIILSLDLPNFLTPSVGEFVKRGFSALEMIKHFDVEAIDSDEVFDQVYGARISQDTTDLIKFVGLVARLHAFINSQEDRAFLPGAKTIIATGYRRPFFTNKREDFLSANFSFSNAYEADKHLHGPNMYLDNNIAQLLYSNRFARNLLRFACYVRRSELFDPFGDYDDVLSLSGQTVVKLQPIEMALFRVSFSFRELDPAPLAYLQVIGRLSKYLDGKEETQAKNLWLGIFEAIQNGPTADGESGRSWLRTVKADIQEDISLFSRIVEEGDSAIFKLQREKNLTITTRIETLPKILE